MNSKDVVQYIADAICDNDGKFDAKAALVLGWLAGQFNVGLEDIIVSPVDEKKDGLPAFYRLHVASCGPLKIQCIKHIREYTGLGLKEAKEISEGMYQTFPMDATMAQELREQLKSLGAQVELIKES